MLVDRAVFASHMNRSIAGLAADSAFDLDVRRPPTLTILCYPPLVLRTLTYLSLNRPSPQAILQSCGNDQSLEAVPLQKRRTSAQAADPDSPKADLTLNPTQGLYPRIHPNHTDKCRENPASAVFETKRAKEKRGH